MTTFIGIDLAWAIDRNHTGIAVLRGDARGAQLVAVSEGVCSHDRVVHFVRQHSTVDTVAAVDASLVVTNRSGPRACEIEVAKAYGAQHASCHPTHQGRPYWDTGPKLVAALAQHDFVHDFVLTQPTQRRGRWLFEVYPHPATLQLFKLPRIIRYKKGPVAARRRELARYRALLASLVSGRPGWRATKLLKDLLARDIGALKGGALKAYEDQLDALLCAYVAWHCWRWGPARNEVHGTLEHGYIVVPIRM